MADFTVGDDHFRLDGKPVRLLSGALHYFRVHEAQWDHRLSMLRAMGLNCVETYVPWNLHEPRPGRFRDVAALGRFLDAAQRAGLWAIVRPGPYICAEWENGGLPAWVTGRFGRRVRTRDEEYLGAVERWFTALLPQVVQRQIGRGGPVIMVQAENEYGSYGTDQVYLRRVAGMLRERGVTVPLFTSDGPEDHMLTGGSVPGLLATANFGSGAREAFEVLRRHQPKGPLMCMEFWCGWFEHWGAEPVVHDPERATDSLREILECGASVNIYMAHGGTNFAGWAGANRSGPLQDGDFQPTVTSYDYDAPIDEYGRPTEKFRQFRKVLAEYADGPLPELPPEPVGLAAPVRAELTGWAPLTAVLEALGDEESAPSGVPPTFEELGVDRGLVRYQVAVPGPRRPYTLGVAGLRDRAVVYVDGVREGVLSEENSTLDEPVAGPAEVELWVESLGRVNYGPRLGEPKGITGGVQHERQFLHGVRARALRLEAFEEPDALAAVAFGSVEGAGRPGLFRGEFEAAGVAGTGHAGLELPGWTRGFVWVNGFCLGRYWSAGPQRTLYVPGPVLREGTNEVWVLELEDAGAPYAELGPGVPVRTGTPGEVQV
ncbi:MULTISPECIES: glycoside hydrolase family 35 protein [unclassified Streptomyces]|uniref:glycoside hydrolase family 35 protein n=1 Tax=unclassified Streptomyces TaxID=2593676 RepID=UPI002257FA8C|nr:MULTISPECIES: beta-galactosidase family protein [unclassified Streptomyces]WSP54521.1 beta-galactosidase [Streptomyces sp. NBC_01241]WSU24802.1 beta-galactosidase [Streptomyces sp. NBC_01108]MCX4786061.1 beta-galactosidase [Streptomyces sp. NBC_01221]MCX4798082.1 beta-galactosidase [Streptomyces sp. NBC_01242]WSJ39336.1 beta-galactosidase [Streptomyces sp. NBC_01321]